MGAGVHRLRRGLLERGSRRILSILVKSVTSGPTWQCTELAAGRGGGAAERKQLGVRVTPGGAARTGGGGWSWVLVPSIQDRGKQK